MEAFEPEDPDAAKHIRTIRGRHTTTTQIGATLDRVETGAADIAVGKRADLAMQHDCLYRAATTAIAVSACGYAAATLTPMGSGVVSLESKVNLILPAVGQRFTARGPMCMVGRTIRVARRYVLATGDGSLRRIATMLATIIMQSLPLESVRRRIGGWT